ncbi:MAG: choice-of-anchor D domain-containing protein, partial [Ktedonobacteraceae bacterium]|nr:choice-of-anchor D domain-containing protein [Ktedonobacteraceae bacterium]
MFRKFWNNVWLRARLLVGSVLILTVLLTLQPQFPRHSLLSIASAEAATPNPIQIENSKPGDPTWNDFSSDLQPDTISGYGSKISVNHGDSIDFFVTTTAPSFTIDIFRTGWYGGLGARLITSMGSFTGVHRAIPSPDPVTGIVACNWPKTTTLTIPSDWVTGVYLARLNASNGNKSFIFFVVRNDGGHEGLVFQTSVTTYQAYNTWGGTSLYNNNTNRSVFTYPHATKVSFDRPFNPGDSNGAGHYFWWEYKFVRWAEAQGYDLTYITDVDTQTNVNPLTNHKAFLSVGHDEYWSKGMRDNVESAISAGVNVGFFSANTAYWQIRFESSAAGVPNRVEVGYKDFANFNIAPGPDPMYGVNNAVVTTYWRDPVVNKPENGLIGVMYEQQVYQDETFVVTNASHWVYAGTGLVNGSRVPGIVGYEYDRVWNNGFSPPGLTVLGHSPVSACCGTGNSFADTTIYTAASGARVFASGTIQWSLGLDNSQGNTYANAGIQKMTANLLNNFIGGSSQAIGAAPSSLSFSQQNVGTTSSPQQITITNTGTSALTLNSIAISGSNAGDFAQTNTCPGSLAAGGSCVVTVTFSPSAAGSRSASVTVASSAPNSPLTIPLSGTGVSPNPAVTLNPASLSFGNQNVNTTSAARAVTLTNSGGAALTISSITISGTNASYFAQDNNCPSSLAAGANCTINVSFTPTGAGNSSANLTITDNASTSPQNVALSGTGVVPAPAVSLSSSSLNFGSQKVGVTSAAQNVTLTNSGTAVLTISGISVAGANAGDFAQTNTCPGTLAAGANCSISVKFTPGAAGNRSASLTITDNASNSPQSVGLSGTGVT